MVFNSKATICFHSIDRSIEGIASIDKQGWFAHNKLKGGGQNRLTDPSSAYTVGEQQLIVVIFQLVQYCIDFRRSNICIVIVIAADRPQAERQDQAEQPKYNTGSFGHLYLPRLVFYGFR